MLTTAAGEFYGLLKDSYELFPISKTPRTANPLEDVWGAMIFSILKTLALGIWLGSLLMLGYAVAGPIFQQSPSKTLAGAINGIILGRMNSIEWVCALVALATAIILLALNWAGETRAMRMAEVAILCVSIVLLWFYSNRITGRMETLRQTIGDFDHPKQTKEYVEAKADFDDLHHRYTKLVGINMVLILGGFVLSMVNVRR